MPRLLGIQYATATRFERPRSHDFDAEADYSRFGPAAPQRADAGLVPGMAIRETDEHACLTLNVWTPALDGSRPVLVWFPGGQFARGSSSQPMYDGARLSAEQDVVVVTVNYRLGALGFLDTDRSAVTSPTSASTTRSPHSSGCSVTSSGSAVTRNA